MNIVLATRDEKTVQIAREVFGDTHQIFSLVDLGIIGETTEEDFGELHAIWSLAEAIRQKLSPQQDSMFVLATRNAACLLSPCGTRKYIELDVSDLSGDDRLRAILQAVYSAISKPKETEVEEL